jgi:GNAT superfamily N-acetyltransferase
MTAKLETIRAYRETDLDGTIAANLAVGWVGRRMLVEFYSRRSDTTLLVAEVDGEIVGCGGATVFPGTPVTGWVHGIVVRPEHRRGGLGRRLTEAAIEHLRARSVATVLLLATDAGRPIYERLGFAEGERYGSFPWRESGGAALPEARRMTPSDLSEVRALDRAATGEDRGAFIESLVAGGWVTTRAGAIDAFHLACPWGGGPIVARDPASGLAMAGISRRLQPGPSRGVGVPLTNDAAMRHLAALGVTAERHVTRMWLGTPPSWRPDMIFGVFNFGVG